ncbi:hypothetical protein NTJ24_000425 [Yersinia ruckeri]|uniref:hypothetical protein n=1 Tax=Yersinia ruckeri TaxID=29486 RepID=UPI0020BEDF4D|nr:hypothetical protein [Yersinia ruckeri]EKN4181786.1 hypothetical protein [Yersinia ruckeri]EKN4206950.1 hypothetical protein [Yersinia ruckeri]MCK8554474.1 hypothetical protein [Yersinia ruckeri]
MAKVLALIVAAFVAGWYVNDLQHDSAELSITRAANQAAENARVKMEGVASESARQLEKTLEGLHSQEGQFQQVIHTEIIKPVFTNVCATDEYVRLFNDSTTAAERTLSGQSVNTVQ